jgi:hypothetical protein
MSWLVPIQHLFGAVLYGIVFAPGLGAARALETPALAVMVGPIQNHRDLAIMKNTKLGLLEGDNVLFRGEMFSAFNHPQFGMPGDNVNAPATFGVTDCTLVPGRVVQFGLKYEF